MSRITSAKTELGAFTGPNSGTAQDDNVKASLDLAHTDLDTIIAHVDTLELVTPRYIENPAQSLTSGTIDDVFTIAGGDILVLALWSTVTTVCSNNSVTMGYTWDPTAGAGTDTAIASGVDVDSAAVGDSVCAEGDATAAVIKAIGTAVPIAALNSGFILGPGGIDIEMQSSNLTTGIVTAKMIYIPLQSGTTVTAS